MLCLLGVGATRLSAAPAAKVPNPVLIDPLFPSLFVSFAGYGSAFPTGEQKMFEVGQPVPPQLTVTPRPGDFIWLRLVNNTRSAVTIPTNSAYLNGLLHNGMQVSVQYVVYDESGKLIPSPFDTGSMAKLPPDCTVFFAVAPQDLEAHRRIRFEFEYDWEPRNQALSGKSITHEVVIDEMIIPPAARKSQ